MANHHWIRRNEMARAEGTMTANADTPGFSRGRSIGILLDKYLGYIFETSAAALVVTEVVVLFVGIVFRYVLDRPLIWSDELASILFLWLAMLGAAVAFRRGEHMRMTALVARFSSAQHAFLDLVATCAALAFLLLIAGPSWDYAYQESVITTPALQISNMWRAAALPVGIGTMAVFAMMRLARTDNIRALLCAVAMVASIIVVLWLMQPWLRSLGNLNLVIFFVGVTGFCVFAGVPIAFGFGLAIYGYLALTTHTPLMVLVGRMDEGMSHLILLAVPLFVFHGRSAGRSNHRGDIPVDLNWIPEITRDGLSRISLHGIENQRI